MQGKMRGLFLKERGAACDRSGSPFKIQEGASEGDLDAQSKTPIIHQVNELTKGGGKRKLI